MKTLTVWAGGRRRRLFRQNHGNWIVRFTVRGKEIERSLGTTIENIAKDKARELIEAEINDDVRTSRKLKVKSDNSSLKQVVDIFLEQFAKAVARELIRNSESKKGKLILRDEHGWLQESETRRSGTKKQSIKARVPTSMRREVSRRASLRGESESVLVREALSHYLSETDRTVL